MSIVIGYLNRIRSAVLTGGSWLAAAPLTELQTRSRARCARSSNALTTSTQFDIDLGSAMACQGFAIPNHNASSSAQWQITAGTAAGGSSLLDSGLINCQQVSDSAGVFEWGDTGFWEGTGDQWLRNTHPLIYIAPSQVSARYWRIAFTDTGNADGYLQISPPYVGPVMIPEFMDVYARPEGFTDYATFDRSAAGTTFAREGLKAKRTELDLARLSEDEARVFRGVMRRDGANADILWAPSATDAVAQQEYGFVGRITSGLEAIARSSYLVHSARITLEERI